MRKILKSKSRLSLCCLIVLGICLVNPSVTIMSVEAQAVSVDLSVLPASQTVSGSGNFTLTVQAQCNGQSVDGIETFLDFDPSRLEVQAITPGTALGFGLQNTYDNTLGTIDYSAGSLINPLPSNTFTVFTISFKTRPGAANSTTPVNFHASGNTSSRQTFVDLAGSPVQFNLVGAAITLQNQTPSSPANNSPAASTTSTSPTPSNSVTSPPASSPVTPLNTGSLTQSPPLSTSSPRPNSPTSTPATGSAPSQSATISPTTSRPAGASQTSAPPPQILSATATRPVSNSLPASSSNAAPTTTPKSDTTSTGILKPIGISASPSPAASRGSEPFPWVVAIVWILAVMAIMVAVAVVFKTRKPKQP